jgi:hypothetical protein
MHIAHASVAPSCAMALYRDGHLQVWSHTQGVYPLRAALARALKLDPATISVKHVQGPGCYGHNGADDAAADAAVIAMRKPGIPVRVRWRREEEFGFEPVSPAMGAVRATIWRGAPPTGPSEIERLAFEAARRQPAGRRGVADRRRPRRATNLPTRPGRHGGEPLYAFRRSGSSYLIPDAAHLVTARTRRDAQCLAIEVSSTIWPSRPAGPARLPPVDPR